RLQAGIVVDQRAGDAVPNRTGLTRFTATVNVDQNVETGFVFDQRQRLAQHHARGFAREVFVRGLVVDDDVALAGLQKNARNGAFATAGTIVVFTNHLNPQAWL